MFVGVGDSTKSLNEYRHICFYYLNISDQVGACFRIQDSLDWCLG